MSRTDDVRAELANWRDALEDSLNYRERNLLPLERIDEIRDPETAEWLRKAHAHAESVIAECERKISELEVELAEGWDSEIDELIELVEMAEECALDELDVWFDTGGAEDWPESWDYEYIDAYEAFCTDFDGIPCDEVLGVVD